MPRVLGNLQKHQRVSANRGRGGREGSVVGTKVTKQKESSVGTLEGPQPPFVSPGFGLPFYPDSDSLAPCVLLASLARRDRRETSFCQLQTKPAFFPACCALRASVRAPIAAVERPRMQAGSGSCPEQE